MMGRLIFICIGRRGVSRIYTHDKGNHRYHASYLGIIARMR